MMALICVLSVSYFNLKAQCPATSAFYAFSTGGKNYHLVKQQSNRFDALACAGQRQGYLAEINSPAEQNGIFSALQSPQAGIVLSNTTASDGGGASYVWLGGLNTNSDSWQWGNSNIEFWQGTTPNNGGHPLNGAYTNWGVAEPDNFNNNQDYLALALTSWPGGNVGEWNDLRWINGLYYVIEYDGVLSTDEAKTDKSSVRIYPNAVTDFLTIESKKIISSVDITDASGKRIKSVSGTGRASEKIDCTSLPDGVYFVNIHYQDKTASQHKVIKDNK